jgi:hypothetical protein
MVSWLRTVLVVPFTIIALISAAQAQTMLLPGSPVDAQYVVPANGSLAIDPLENQVRAARSSLDASLVPTLESRTTMLLQAIDQFEQDFLTRGSPDLMAAWQRYASTEALRSLATVPSDRKARGKATELINRVQLRLRRNEPGMERPSVDRLRTAITQYEVALRHRDPEASLKLVDSQLERLEQSLADPQGNSREQQEIASRVTQLLTETNQAASLLASIRSRYSRPNIHLRVAPSLINRFLSQAVSQSQPVCESILGTRFTGNSQVVGSVSTQPIHSIGTARVVLLFSGQFSSQNTGYNRKVRVQTVGSAQVAAQRTIEVSLDGVRAIDQATASGNVQSQLTSIDHPLRFVERLARRRASEQQGQANAIASGRLRQRLAEQFSQQVDEQLSQPAPRSPLNFDPQTVLSRLGLRAATPQLGSDPAGIYVDLNQRQSNQLSSPSPPPASPNTGIQLQVHQSLINNAISPILSGRTLTDRDLDRIASQLKLPERKVGAKEEEPFSVTFAPLQPIVFEPSEHQLRIGIRGTSFRRGARSIDRPLEVTATYVPARRDDGTWMMLRSGDVEIGFPGRSKLSWQEAGLKGAIKDSFANIFPEAILDQPISANLPQRGPTNFRISHLSVDQGWLSVAVE